MDDDPKASAARLSGPLEDDGEFNLSADQDIDRLSAAVYQRLKSIPDSEAVHDPQGTLLAVAADVDRTMPRRPSASIDATHQDEAKRFYQECVDALSPQCREILLIHVNEGLTYQQIACRLGLSAAYVLRQLIHAYSGLRNHRVLRTQSLV